MAPSSQSHFRNFISSHSRDTLKKLFKKSNSLSNFSYLSSKTNDHVVFITGNQAGDLDSIVSSVALAYAWNDLNITKSKKKNGIAFPVVSFPRAQFKLRGDARKLFHYAGFNEDFLGAPNDIIFIDELNDYDLSGSALALTDHNMLDDAICKHFKDRETQQVNVVAVVDHHQDSGLFASADLRIIDATCGSCCSLIGKLMLERCPQKLVEAGDLVTLLIGTILLDTRNFSPKHKRFCQLDIDVYRSLMKLLPTDLTTEIDHGKWYQELKRARNDVSHLSVVDHLSLDFKSLDFANFQKIGFSSIMCSLSAFLKSANGAEELVSHMHDFMKSRNLAALFCFCAAEEVVDTHQEAFNRKGLVVTVSPDLESSSLFFAIKKVLYECPGFLSTSLKTNATIITQDIQVSGFDPQEWQLECEEFDGAKFFHLRGIVTRKTLLPVFAELLPLFMR